MLIETKKFKDVNWSQFANDVKDQPDPTGSEYYIKDDLRKFPRA